jgi:hypothetical protein
MERIFRVNGPLGGGLGCAPQAQAPWEYRAQERTAGAANSTPSAAASRRTRTDAGAWEIYTGPQGGKFCYTDHGTKVYLKQK